MATQLQLRRGTTSENASFTGAVGEVTVDTTKDTLIVQDGSTAGGHELAKADGTNITGVDSLENGGNTKVLATITGIDVTGTATMDGLVVEAGIAQLQLIDTGVSGSTKLRTANAQTWLEIDPDNVQASSGFATYIDGKKFLNIADTGDISFYDQSGTSQALFWDASAESLGIGTSSPSETLAVESTSNNAILLNSPANRYNAVGFQSAGVDKWWMGRADTDIIAGDAFFIGADAGNATDAGGTSAKLVISSSGNVGIGESDPSGYWSQASQLVIEAGNCGLTLKSAASGNGRLVFTDTKSTTAGLNDGGMISYSHTDDAMVVQTAGAEAMRIDSSGNLLVGTTNANNVSDGIRLKPDGFISAANTSGPVLYANRLSTDGSILSFQKDGATVGSIGTSATANFNITSGQTGHGGIEFGTANIMPMLDGILDDNATDLGNVSYRWKDIYAANATINTSDRNEKQDIEELSTSETAVAVACKGLLRKFRWKDSVAEKGDDARIHFGIIAQDLQSAFAAEGLDAGDYAMFISSTWTDEETNEEKTRMGVRYSELLAFIISAL